MYRLIVLWCSVVQVWLSSLWDSFPFTLNDILVECRPFLVFLFVGGGGERGFGRHCSGTALLASNLVSYSGKFLKEKTMQIDS